MSLAVGCFLAGEGHFPYPGFHPECFPPLGTIVPWRALTISLFFNQSRAEMEGENVHE